MKASSLLPAVLMVGGSLSLAAARGMGPPDPHSVAAVFPPWWSTQEIVQAAASAGLLMAPGATRSVVFLRSEADDLPARAAAAGALLVLPGSTLGLCGQS